LRDVRKRGLDDPGLFGKALGLPPQQDRPEQDGRDQQDDERQEDVEVPVPVREHGGAVVADVDHQRQPRHGLVAGNSGGAVDGADGMVDTRWRLRQMLGEQRARQE
jgi:hypothetical protein